MAAVLKGRAEQRHSGGGVNDFSVGAFRASIRREHKEQFLDCYGTRMGVKVFQTVETPVYALVLPRRSCVTEEFAHFASLAGQDVPIGLSLNSRDIGQGKGRYAFMVRCCAGLPDYSPIGFLRGDVSGAVT